MPFSIALRILPGAIQASLGGAQVAAEGAGGVVAGSEGIRGQVTRILPLLKVGMLLMAYVKLLTVRNAQLEDDVRILRGLKVRASMSGLSSYALPSPPTPPPLRPLHVLAIFMEAFLLYASYALLPLWQYIVRGEGGKGVTGNVCGEACATSPFFRKRTGGRGTGHLQTCLRLIPTADCLLLFVTSLFRLLEFKSGSFRDAAPCTGSPTK